jgi:gliding-associated putative ABC transporter substrate-binding component GldG
MKTIKSSSIISLFLLLGILVLINAIAVRTFVRLDLTSAKMYTLAPASKTIVGNIEDTLIIKAYFSPNLPSPYNTVSQYLRDMLEDYRAYSKGHIRYEFIDPGSEQKFAEEAQSFRIPPQQIQAVQNDKIEVKLCYMGVVFIYGDKREVIPVVAQIENLEYEITSLIKRLTTTQLSKLGITSTGSSTNQVSTQNLYEALARNYSLSQISLDEPIPQDYAGVMLIAPRKALTDWQLFNLDQYIMNGGKVAIMANYYQGDMRNNVPYVYNNLNLDNFLRNYGIAIGNDLLYDDACGTVPVQFRQQQSFFVISQQVKIPYLPILQYFNRDFMVTSGMGRLPVFFPSSVDTSLAAAKGYEVEGLMYTSLKSGRERSSSITIDVNRRWTQDDFIESLIPVAAVVKGTFTSFFAVTGAPQKMVEQEDGQIVASPQSFTGSVKTVCDVPNRLMVVGDGNIALDDYLSNSGLDFVLNTADWLAQTEDLISIRSKQVSLKPLKEIPDFSKKVVKWMNMIGPVVLIIVLGIVLWQIRRIRKKALMVQ